jgi:hypothetical protein
MAAILGPSPAFAPSSATVLVTLSNASYNTEVTLSTTEISATRDNGGLWGGVDASSSSNAVTRDTVLHSDLG